MNEFRKQMQNNRGYGEMIVLTKYSKLICNSLGGELVQIAIMAYLHDPSLDMERLIKIAKENSPMVITEQEAEEAMKDSLINICTRNCEKIDNEDTLEIYIHNIASEVRVSEMLRVKSEIEGFSLDNLQIERICRLVLRVKMKPENSFEDSLKHVALREEMEERDFAIFLCQALFERNLRSIISADLESFSKDKNIQEIENKKTEILKPYLKRLEDFVNLLIKEHENLQF